MIPTGFEFTTLYILYGILFLFLSIGALISENKKGFIKNLLFFFSYSAIMIYVFLDKENFKYGSSLAVLGLGGLFLLIHLGVLIVRRIIFFISKKANI